jgi:hypothetical protein
MCLKVKELKKIQLLYIMSDYIQKYYPQTKAVVDKNVEKCVAKWNIEFISYVH